MRKFPLFHMASIKDIFPETEDYTWIKAKEKMNVARMYKATSKRHLAIQVFHAFMKDVLEDMVDEGAAILLPYNSAALFVEQVPEETVEMLRENGRLQQYSTLFNQGKVYVPMYRYKKGDSCIKRYVVLGKEMYDRLVAHVNNGKRYMGYTRQW